MFVRNELGNLFRCAHCRAWPSSLRTRGRFSGVATGRPFQLAIVGSGPAGFYSAHRVMTRIQDARIDMFEKLPVPFGLVRFGVAPDHPEVKNCEDKFFETASSSNFRFAGNVEIGKDLALSDLAENYDAILFAYGASQDRQLGIPGESLKGVHSARAFVGWYNGLPEYSNLSPDLDSDVAVVIGNGNVALDVARVLLTGVDKLRETDITENSLEALSKSRIRRVHVVGRRGPLQASFTVKEVRELMELPDVGFRPIPSELFPPPDVKLPRVPKRMSQLLFNASGRPQDDKPRNWSLDFLRSPVRFCSSKDWLESLGSVELAHNAFVKDGNPFAATTKIESSSERSTLEASIAFRSVGYKADPIPGMKELGIQFDHTRGIIPNQVGKIMAAGRPLKGLYCAGWVKSGPNGVIATTMADAFITAEAIAADWGSQKSDKPGWDGVKNLIPQRVDWDAWLKINTAELASGKRGGKVREKFPTVAEMLQASE